MQKITSLI